MESGRALIFAGFRQFPGRFFQIEPAPRRFKSRACVACSPKLHGRLKIGGF